MKCSCTWTPVLALAGLAALGLGGYNMMKSGCILGQCDSAPTAAAVTTAAHAESDCCGTAKTECATECDKTAADCSKCPLAQDHAVTTAAFDATGSTAKSECSAAKAECAGKTECTKTDGVAKAGCEGKSECPSTKVADKGTPEIPPQN